jgi:hypothetical protein
VNHVDLIEVIIKLMTMCIRLTEKGLCSTYEIAWLKSNENQRLSCATCEIPNNTTVNKTIPNADG